MPKNCIVKFPVKVSKKLYLCWGNNLNLIEKLILDFVETAGQSNPYGEGVKGSRNGSDQKYSDNQESHLHWQTASIPRQEGAEPA